MTRAEAGASLGRQRALYAQTHCAGGLYEVVRDIERELVALMDVCGMNTEDAK